MSKYWVGRKSSFTKSTCQHFHGNGNVYFVYRFYAVWGIDSANFTTMLLFSYFKWTFALSDGMLSKMTLKQDKGQQERWFLNSQWKNQFYDQHIPLLWRLSLYYRFGFCQLAANLSNSSLILPETQNDSDKWCCQQNYWSPSIGPICWFLWI